MSVAQAEECMQKAEKKLNKKFDWFGMHSVTVPRSPDTASASWYFPASLLCCRRRE